MAVKIAVWRLLNPPDLNHAGTVVHFIFPLIMLVALSSCAKVGSDAWCEKQEDKPKGDWTANEAGDYTQYCVMGIDPDEE
jgi:hypothetical protein